MSFSNEALVVVLLIGLIAGSVTGNLVKVRGPDLATNLVVGVVGAFFGYWLLPLVHIHVGSELDLAGDQRCARDNDPDCGVPASRCELDVDIMRTGEPRVRAPVEDAELEKRLRQIRRGRHGGGIRRRLTVYQLRLDFGLGPEGTPTKSSQPASGSYCGWVVSLRRHAAATPSIGARTERICSGSCSHNQ